MEDKAKDKKRFVLDMPIEGHKELKLRATRRNVTMKKYVLDAIWLRIDQERKYEKE